MSTNSINEVLNKVVPALETASTSEVYDLGVLLLSKQQYEIWNASLVMLPDHQSRIWLTSASDDSLKDIIDLDRISTWHINTGIASTDGYVHRASGRTLHIDLEE